jgi:hypothetical protein
MTRRQRHSRGAEDDIKFAPGVGARVPASQRPLGVLERVTLAHVAIFVIAATWASAADSVVTPLAWWGSLGVLLALTAVQDRDAWRDGWMRPLVWLWPFLAFNVLVVIACLNPDVPQDMKMAVLADGGRAGFIPVNTAVALRALWIFDGVWIACFNLALIIRQRRALRLLLLIAVTNGAALAILGMAQKFFGARRIFFNSTFSTHSDFFATFLNHHHWGAFVVLMIAAGLALVWHYGRRREARDFFLTPAFAGIAVVGTLAATLPLSLTRSSTAIAIGLGSAALVQACIRMIQRRRQFRESVVLPVAGAITTVALGLAAIWFVLGESKMLRDSTEPANLARNTWELAKARPWFGWGMGSYPRVLAEDITPPPPAEVVLPDHLVDPSWLRAFAEHGVAGCSLLALCAIVPLLRLRRRHLSSPVPAYLLAGCTLMVIDAAFGIPFENVAVGLSWWLCFFSAVQYARLQDREMPTPKISGASIGISPSTNCSAAV